MRSFSLAALALCAVAGSASATLWQVGPGRAYTKPSEVSALVGDGDTVAIDAGVYDADVARWSANDLVLKGVGGYAHLRAQGKGYGGKAIWVNTGDRVTIDSIEFSGCAVPDHNGAGIRHEGTNLTVRACRFHDNENGILTNANAEDTIVIEHSEFSNNGYGDGYTHNLYIGRIATLIFRFNISQGTRKGHELKSRAQRNYIICNRFANGPTGTASREIDISNGGFAVIAGNEIEQGPQAENSGIIGFGFEGYTSPAPQQLFVMNNTVVNDRGTGTFVALQAGADLYVAWNNIFAGAGTPLVGTAATLDTAHNLICPIAEAGLTDPSAGDYSLLPLSPAINAGGVPSEAEFAQHIPTQEYHHPTGEQSRTLEGMIDIGAHEREITLAVGSASERPLLHITSTSIAVDPALGGARLALYDCRGQLVLDALFGSEGRFDTRALPAGLYLYTLDDAHGRRRSSGKVLIAR